MSVNVNWNGDIIKSSEPTKERSTLGGMFTSAKNIQTYYPLAPIYSRLLPTINIYKVPPHYAEKPGLIAKELYGSEDYWWVIFWSNGVIDPFGRPYTGELIRVINIQDLNNLVGNK